MTGIDEALAECDFVTSSDKILWQRIDHKHHVVCSTLARGNPCETRSQEEVSTSQQNLQPQ